MPLIRLATPADAPTIASQRVKMFQDNQLTPVGTWEELERDSVTWIEGKLRDDTYVGWLAEVGGNIVGGAGVWFMEFPPHWMHPEPLRGHLLNFYVAPEARGHGLAKKFVSLAVEECSRRGVHVATLHASDMGRPIYASLGWVPTPEMMFRLKK